MRTDSDIGRDMKTALRRCREIDSAQIIIAVNSGIVTLTGFVRSYSSRRRTEAAIRHLAGVRSIFNLIQIESLFVPIGTKQVCEIWRAKSVLG